MNDLTYLLIANLLIWLTLFAYIYNINRKQNRIQEKIRVIQKNE